MTCIFNVFVVFEIAFPILIRLGRSWARFKGNLMLKFIAIKDWSENDAGGSKTHVQLLANTCSTNTRKYLQT